MGKTTTNLIIVLGLITITFAGYYMFVQNATSSISSETNDQMVQDMLNSTSVFIVYTNILSQATLDINFFEDERFSLLRSFTTQVQEQPIGRPDPFANF
ncbi:MAG: hypothetical protein ACI9BF_000376 [Candidatus Paceibacteria bacterium]|jgi:hypothetical protein